MVVAYRASALTAAIFLRLVRVRFASIVNLVCDRPVIPELIQDECRSDRLHAAVSRLLQDPSARQTQLEGFREASAALGKGRLTPSRRAADIILDMAGGQRT